MTDKKEEKTTPAVVNKVPLVVGDGQDFNKVIMGQYKKIVTNFLSDEDRARKFVVGVVSAIQKVPKLQNCTSTSLINSFMTMADAGFMPSEVMGQSYVIPYGTTATFQISYHGVIDLMSRAGISGLSAEVIRKGDKYGHKNGKYFHEIDMEKSSEERGAIIGAIATAEFNGGLYTSFMNIKDIEKHKVQYSKAHSFKDSPWNTAPEEMYKKTVILKLSKLLPKSDKFRKILEVDYQGESSLEKRIESAKESSKSLTMGQNETTKNKK